MEQNNLLSTDDLADVLSRLSDLPDTAPDPTAEELASLRRYEQIIKKHKEN